MFPVREHFIPSKGTYHSQPGNIYNSHHILRRAGKEGLDVADDYLKQAGAGFGGGPGYVGSDEGIGLRQQGNAGPLASNS